jgi:hypothetical protein
LNRDLEQLVALQAVDLEMRHLRAGLESAPRRVAAAEKTRAAAETAKLAAEKSLAREEALRRSQESDVEDRQGKIARLRRQMDTAVSAAQIAALEHEISFAETAIARLEDEELSSMERTEALEAQRDEATRSLSAAETAIGRERDRAAELIRNNQAALVSSEGERSQLRSEITDDMLAVYDRVSKSRGTGLAEAVEGKCSACQMKLRPQRWNDLTGREHKDDIFTCESCGRILFWDPRRDAPGSWPAGDRLKAALTAAEGKA